MSTAAGVKICGVTRREDVRVCADCGVDAIGLNLWPGSRRYLTLPEARSVLDGPAAELQRVGVFVDPEPDTIAAAVEALALDVVQLHGDAPIGRYARLGFPYVWVIRGTPTLEQLEVPVPTPSWILLDASVPQFGGAGVVTDWAWARRAVRHLAPTPVWLAGGINPANAQQALATVAPAGLDVASGAERDGAERGEKDPAKIAALMTICQKGAT